MAQVIWLASYPRSGNTWLRFILANLLGTRIVRSSQIEKTIPDFHTPFHTGILYEPGTRLIKTHWVHKPLLPLREDTVGVVYVMRNPIDVMLSGLNHRLLVSKNSQLLDEPEARRSFAEAWIDEYIALGGERIWKSRGYGSWEEHVRSWTTTTLPYPRLVVRYEDLKGDPLRQVDRLCRFLDLDRTAGQRAEAVKRSSFESLRALEEREIRGRREGLFYEARKAAGLAQGMRFINRGEVGVGESMLSETQRRAAIDRFGAAMREFGYPVPQP